MVAELLVVLANAVDTIAMKLFVRVGKECTAGATTFSYTTNFRREKRLKRICRTNYYAVPIRLSSEQTTTFVELLDTTTDTSSVIILRHGRYGNPYAPERTQETLAEVTRGEEEQEEEEEEEEEERRDFVTGAFDLANVKIVSTKMEETATDPVLEIETMYERDRPVFVESSDDRFVAGLYWCNAKHWEECNERHIWSAPLTNSLISVNTCAHMPSYLRQLHMSYVSALEKSVVYDALLPNDLLEALPSICTLSPNVEKKLQRSVLEETLRALVSAAHADSRSSTHHSFIDYRESVLLLTRYGLYGIGGGEAKGNPLTPVFNEYTRRRWNLETYVKKLWELTTSTTTIRSPVEWCTFFIRNAVIVGVDRGASELNYGVTRYVTDPLRTMQARLKAAALFQPSDDHVNEIIADGLSPHPTYVCSHNTRTGHIYVSHPLFARGKCVLLQSPPLSSDELMLLRGPVSRAAVSLDDFCIHT
jgi:hypothetical protein